MQYREIIEGKFVDRPNRFIAHVMVNDVTEMVHVKNTGRCRELLLPGVDVRLEVSDNPARKTKYDLVAVYKKTLGWVNIDSQAPNKVVKEWLDTQDYDLVRPEYRYGASRVDFYMEKGDMKYLMAMTVRWHLWCKWKVSVRSDHVSAYTRNLAKHLTRQRRTV